MKNKLKIIHFLIAVCLCSIVNITQAANTPQDKIKLTKLGLYLSATEAYNMLQKHNEILFIDVRTRAEIAFLGMANNVDANIPYMVAQDWDEWSPKKHNFKLSPNSNFLPYFNDFIHKQGLNKNTTIILICRSGNRSAGAANLLEQVGYTKVYSVIDGFEGDHDQEGHRTVNGWKNEDLPWSYTLDEKKMYMEF